jgi:hypothetical protein
VHDEKAGECSDGAQSLARGESDGAAENSFDHLGELLIASHFGRRLFLPVSLEPQGRALHTENYWEGGNLGFVLTSHGIILKTLTPIQTRALFRI